jgi:hypothetical protein
MLHALVYRMQTYFHCMVIKVVVEFVQDFSGRVWMLHSKECMCVSEKKAEGSNSRANSTSPDAYKHMRTAKVADSSESLGDRVLSSEGHRPGSNERYHVGRFSDARRDEKLARERPPSEELVHSIIEVIEDNSTAVKFHVHRLLSTVDDPSVEFERRRPATIAQEGKESRNIWVRV